MTRVPSDQLQHGVAVVLPAHNEAGTLAASLERVVARLAGVPGSQVIVVENGSTDETFLEARALAERHVHSGVDILATSSPLGLGCAYRRGMELATADLVLLTAADLPFGFTDLEAYLALDSLPPLAIGSKAHPGSIVRAARSRRLMSFGFRCLRLAILGLKQGDTQGTLLIRQSLSRALLPYLSAQDYLISTEIVYLAEQLGVTAIELPVTYPRSKRQSTVSPIKDSWRMARGLLRLRLRRLPAIRIEHAAHDVRVVDVTTGQRRSAGHPTAAATAQRRD